MSVYNWHNSRRTGSSAGLLPRSGDQENEVEKERFEVDCECHRLRTDLQNQDQTKEQLKALPWHWLDQEDLPEEDASDLLDRSAPQKLEGLLSRVSPAGPKLS